MSTKQVIVIRKDLKMRRGKEIAQGSHASMAFLTRRLQKSIMDTPTSTFIVERLSNYHDFNCYLSKVEREWIQSSFAKVCVQVRSEAELLDIHNKALNAGLQSHLICDEGRTEFNNMPTNTAVAIGPDKSEKIDLITGHLELY